MTNRKLVVGALLVAGALASGMAQARSDIQWSLSIGVPIYQQYDPVYAPAYPVYSQPVPMYTPAYPVYTRPVPMYAPPRYHQPTRWDHDGDGIPNRHDRVYNPRWDRDGDGIPNRHDPDYNPRWDRDGDGIPNRHDQAYNPRWDRDGAPNRYGDVRNDRDRDRDRDRDGIPDWQDRYDNRRGR